jgi:hypothetical protein
MMQSICKLAILVTSGLLILVPLVPLDLSNAIGIAGIIILISSMPALGMSFKKPVYVFLTLFLFLFFKYQLSFTDIVNGVNSMLAIVAILAVMQIFAIPLKAGNYERVLEKYLQLNFKKEVSLYVFVNIITHVLGSFMLAGSIPMLINIFSDPLNKMVHNSKRFLATALVRSFALVALWAPGTVNVILILEVTGATWLQIILPVAFLTILGLVTSVLLEAKLHLKDHSVQVLDVSGIENNKATEEDKKKFRTLILISVGLIASIVAMEKFDIMTSTTRVIAAGLVISSFWILRYAGKPELNLAIRLYWEKSIFVARDVAALFISMGIFAEAVNQAGLLLYMQSAMNSSVGLLGQYSYLLIPPVLIILSLVGIHPFISIMLIGKMLVATIQFPHYEVYIALSLLLGGVISFVLSPFAGNILTISAMTDCSPKEVGYKWNGLFSLIFLLEGYIFLFVLQMLWN